MTYIKYKNTLYINYKSFIDIDKNACNTVKVEIPLLQYNSTESVDQFVVTCYAREAVDESPFINPKDYKFYEQIVIYPYFSHQMMVFEKIENKNEYKLLNWMENFYWNRTKYLNDQVFNTPVPVRRNVPVDVKGNFDAFIK